jgi:hypothetical protein
LTRLDNTVGAATITLAVVAVIAAFIGAGLAISAGSCGHVDIGSYRRRIALAP